ncbi:hypothetical protein SAMN05444365_10881 [Micromonospora pattaloongensis]|uniref:DUF4878 domain-containing protein n=1 Tax=Micromonospora pattaloongensis TaxID=405436 RepID=A0A1H3RK98_9ACTN|nr:hypothetical protein [Micromonospora pattaloongensis]SDZ25661.1 hypothetical protein SAMN05444365_10881 [Micromonospora pattaloongensis]
MTIPGPATPPAVVPTPPPGPGARPPFAAPPTEGRTARVWVGIGVAALAVLLCCGGGAAALVGIAVTGTQAVNERSHAVVAAYFDAVEQREYAKAYALLCDDIHRRESVPEFERRVSAEPAIDSYTIGDATIANVVIVPVDVRYDRGGQRTLHVELSQDAGTGEFEVCGIR